MHLTFSLANLENENSQSGIIIGNIFYFSICKHNQHEWPSVGSPSTSTLSAIVR